MRPFIYINPYIADLSAFVTTLRDNLFEIGQQNGYFVKNKDGETYLINSLSIQFATVDLTNPAAREWIKSVIKDNLVEEAKAGGWMHDFGEYLPFDVVLFDGSDPMEYHNRYPDDWAKVCKEALSEVQGGNEIVYFMRAGSSRSAKYTSLFWMGDQLASYDKNDGLQSAMIGLLNGGLSGMTLGHSDIGGYTNFQNPVISYVRDQTLLFRWIEMNTFSDVILRSHPSNMPTTAVQIYDSEDNILFFKKFAVIHARLAAYKYRLMHEAEHFGTPFTRPLLLHFPENKRARREHSEFMLGKCLLMAPIFSASEDSREVFLPGPATWTHAWSGETFTADADGLTLNVYAPLG